ncbi:MAG: hypothetical protein LUI05_08055 [Oscillospiraceae bacterium]|nr:hypothetical protein [Oscillospiraceae bacterium]
MKTKFVIAGIIAAAMLSACSDDGGGDNSVTESLTIQLTSEQAYSEETEILPNQTEISSYGDTEESAAVQSESEQSFIEETENGLPLGISVLDLNAAAQASEGGSWQFAKKTIGDNIICIPFSRKSDSDILVTETELYFVNIESGNIVGTAYIGDWDISDFIGGAEFPVRMTADRFNREASVLETAVITVDENYNVDISDIDAKSSSFEYYGHSISAFNYNIYITDEEPVTIIEGVAPLYDNDYNAQSIEFFLPIDENRFVYRIAGYECIPGFGVYSFSENTASKAEDSQNLMPLGIHNEKIYSYQCYWDGLSADLYITDIESLETELFTELPSVLDPDSEIDMYRSYGYYMPNNGEYIAFTVSSYGDEVGAEIYTIDPDTAEVSLKYSLPAGEGNFYSFFFIGNNKLCSIDNGKMYIFDMT